MTGTRALSPRRAVLLVARREFTGQVRSRSFVVGLPVTVVLFAAIGAIGAVVAGSTTKTLGLTGSTVTLRDGVAVAAAEAGVRLRLRTVDDAGGRAAVAAGDLDALLLGSPGNYRLLGRDAVDPGSGGPSPQPRAPSRWTRPWPGRGWTSRRSNRSPPTVDRSSRSRSGGRSCCSSPSAPTGSSWPRAWSRRSRVVELLLATIKPWQLLAGKILGLGGVGLLQLVILGLIGIGASAAAGLLTVPGAAAGMFVIVIVWYLLGFTLFASLYAAVGSTVSRQGELNPVVAPMIFVIIIPFVLTVNLLPNDPRNELAAVLSFVPFFAQTVMPARYALGVAPLWQVAVSALITLVAIVAVVLLAGRVYRNSILRTGGRIRVVDALRGR